MFVDATRVYGKREGNVTQEFTEKYVQYITTTKKEIKV